MKFDQSEFPIFSIVIVGKFNPKIFHPSWLALHQLISEEEISQSKITISVDNVSVFKVNWFDLEVTLDRFKISTDQMAYFELLRDLAVGIFQLLGHTPVRALGINFSAHFKIHNKKDKNSFLKKIYPMGFWDGILENPSFEKIILKDSSNSKSHLKRVVIEPSNKIDSGLSIECNNHTDLNLIGKVVWKDDQEKTYVEAINAAELISDNYENVYNDMNVFVENFFNKR
jgi:hypothetical protein